MAAGLLNRSGLATIVIGAESGTDALQSAGLIDPTRRGQGNIAESRALQILADKIGAR